MNQNEIEITQIDSYTLGASFCRNSFKIGGSCSFVNKNLNFINVDLRKFSLDRDNEVCTVKVSDTSHNISILSMYRATSGNFVHFLNKLEMILNLLYNSNTQLIICGDTKMKYLVENKKEKKTIDTLLASYNLTSTIYCPTRIQKNSVTTIISIFINISKFEDYIVSPLINGVVDHNAQLIMINDINLKIQNSKPRFIRNIDKYGISDFKIKL